jgi:hypothetical protein
VAPGRTICAMAWVRYMEARVKFCTRVHGEPISRYVKHPLREDVD